MVDANETTPARADVPIVCTMPAEQGSQQLLEWSDLQLRAEEVTAVAGGARMTFPATMVDEVADLARREEACCAFLAIITTVEADTLTLEVTAVNPDALPVISVLAGIPLP